MWLYVMGGGILLFAVIALIIVKLDERKHDQVTHKHA